LVKKKKKKTGEEKNPGASHNVLTNGEERGGDIELLWDRTCPILVQSHVKEKRKRKGEKDIRNVRGSVRKKKRKFRVTIQKVFCKKEKREKKRGCPGRMGGRGKATIPPPP